MDIITIPERVVNIFASDSELSDFSLNAHNNYESNFTNSNFNRVGYTVPEDIYLANKKYSPSNSFQKEAVERIFSNINDKSPLNEELNKYNQKLYNNLSENKYQQFNLYNHTDSKVTNLLCYAQAEDLLKQIDLIPIKLSKDNDLPKINVTKKKNFKTSYKKKLQNMLYPSSKIQQNLINKNIFPNISDNKNTSSNYVKKDDYEAMILKDINNDNNEIYEKIKETFVRGCDGELIPLIKYPYVPISNTILVDQDIQTSDEHLQFKVDNKITKESIDFSIEESVKHVPDFLPTINSPKIYETEKQINTDSIIFPNSKSILNDYLFKMQLQLKTSEWIENEIMAYIITALSNNYNQNVTKSEETYIEEVNIEMNNIEVEKIDEVKDSDSEAKSNSIKDSEYLYGDQLEELKNDVLLDLISNMKQTSLEFKKNLLDENKLIEQEQELFTNLIKTPIASPPSSPRILINSEQIINTKLSIEEKDIEEKDIKVPDSVSELEKVSSESYNDEDFPEYNGYEEEDLEVIISKHDYSTPVITPHSSPRDLLTEFPSPTISLQICYKEMAASPIMINSNHISSQSTKIEYKSEEIIHSPIPMSEPKYESTFLNNSINMESLSEGQWIVNVLSEGELSSTSFDKNICDRIKKHLEDEFFINKSTKLFNGDSNEDKVKQEFSIGELMNHNYDIDFISTKLNNHEALNMKDVDISDALNMKDLEISDESYNNIDEIPSDPS